MEEHKSSSALSWALFLASIAVLLIGFVVAWSGDNPVLSIALIITGLIGLAVPGS